jgi:Ca-activated chloride channel family protein
MNQDPIDLYTALGVGRDAGLKEIESAYSSWQARVDAGEPIATQVRERIRYAYEVLSSPHRRGIYDSLIAETAGSSLRLDIIFSAEKLPLLDTPQVVFALLTLKAATTGQPARPLNLGLVIDRSTSMRGERLKNVLAAVELLLDKLGPEDVLSLVSFSDRATVALPAAALGAATQSVDPETAAAWHEPRRQLSEIVAAGGTEIYQGLRAGLEQVARHATEDRTSHLILLTDGHTYGDAADCLALAEAAAAQGIGITAFGLGADWNDSFLDALVAPSAGQSYFIERPEDVLPRLEGRLQGLGAIYARNLTLRRSWPSQFTLRSASKLTPFLQPLPPDANPLALGDLEGRAPLSLLLEFLVAPQTAATRFRIPLEAHYTAANGAAESVGRTAQLIVPDRERYEAAAPPAQLIEAARRLNLYRMQERAWEEAQAGKTAAAAALMRRLSSRYLETGELRLADQAQREAQGLAQRGAISPEGRKLLKYGTRSLAGDNKP